jgi:hypothetical protein
MTPTPRSRRRSPSIQTRQCAPYEKLLCQLFHDVPILVEQMLGLSLAGFDVESRTSFALANEPDVSLSLRVIRR